MKYDVAFNYDGWIEVEANSEDGAEDKAVDILEAMGSVELCDYLSGPNIEFVQPSED